MRISKPRALLPAAAAGVVISRSSPALAAAAASQPSDARHWEDYNFIDDLRVRTIVGINVWERQEKQDVLLSLKMWNDPLVQLKNEKSSRKSIPDSRPLPPSDQRRGWRKGHGPRRAQLPRSLAGRPLVRRGLVLPHDRGTQQKQAMNMMILREDEEP